MTKTTQIQIRCSDSEKAAIEKRAESHGMKTAEFLRKLGVEGELPTGAVKELRDFEKQSGKIDVTSSPDAPQYIEPPAIDPADERDQWIKATAQALVDEGRLSRGLAERAATTQWERAHE